MQPRKELDSILRPDFDKFFIVKVEDMYRLVTQSVPASRSTNHSCLFITSGEASMKIGSELYTIHKNEMLFVPAGQVFSFKSGEVNNGYLCNFHTDILTGKYNTQKPLKAFEFLRVWGNPMVSLDKQTAGFVVHLFKRLLFDYSRNAINITNRLKELVFTNIRTRHLVTDYAALLNISPNHLNKSVKAVTAKSPARWIDEAIVLEAKVLLSQSDLTISEVAQEVGFEDQSYFTRLFKKYEGITPTDFRRKIELS
ncbi:helix-turn-helix domain-containing protein [Chitinophaga sp. CC14]|uniref:AraC family transcriptional regulator n=1 Tax=Chitinophaga sp. CC14 TaxID=3029199 RepID=UPI003B7AFDF5